MSGGNGKYTPVVAMMGQDEAGSAPGGSPPDGQDARPTLQAPVPAPSPATLQQFGLAMFPFSPVAFTGERALWAYLRLGAYGALAACAWKRARTLSWVLIGAAGVSAFTSLSSTAWGKVNGGAA